MSVRIRRWHSTASRRSRIRRAGLLSVLAVVVVSGSALIAGAAVPEAPNNILVFPDRDFITIEGYEDHKGETATLEVTRNGTVVGSAQGVVSGGAVAFEINHPGGVCWGNGTSLQVTPDIKAGDVATIKFGGTAAGDTTVQDAFVKTVTYDPAVDPTKVTIEGPTNLAAAISGNIEQRVVNPDLVDLIGKRDVRAVPGPLTRAPKSGPEGGYSSGLTVNPDNTFTATYVFDSATVAETVANGGGERVLTWQVLDGAGNRQGVTIAELGELGGPGFGGCPVGPAQQVPPTPRGVSVVRSPGKTSMQVDWLAATAQPGADPVDGYSVELISTSSSAAGRRSQGIRTPAGVTKATFSGLDPAESFTVEVRSTAAGHMSDAGVPSPPHDTSVPTLGSSPAASDDGSAVEAASVALTSTGQVYYTTDSSSPINGDMPADGAKLYADPIPVTGTADAPLEIRAAAFDQAGNHVELQGFYKQPVADAPPPPTTVAATPTDLTGTGGVHKVTLKWTAGDASVTGYRVVAYDKTDAKVSTTSSTTGSATVVNLTAGEKYTFTVAATNDGTSWSDASAPTAPILATDGVTIASAKWKAGDFRVGGSGTDAVTPAGTVTIYNAATDLPIGGATQVTPAAAPATGMAFDVRLRNGAVPASRPAKIYVKSSLGGVSAPFTVG
jgi:Fibronectin type III domain/Chitobiase/beta-hexosaminidase C-terminal domain